MNAKTVRLERGAHASPDDGACVMEVASLLAGERFSDHPRAVCPVIAAFLRGCNDRLDDRARQELFSYASLVVGSAASRSVRRARVELLQVWTWPERRTRIDRLCERLAGRDLVAASAALRAADLDPGRRASEVEALLTDLLAVGAPHVGVGDAAERRRVAA
jgi:hypothetical protein